MSLLKLKSIFQEQAELRTEDFIDQRPQHSNDSRFQFNVPVVGLDFANRTSLNPILDSISFPISSLINFEQTTYDSRVPKNVGIQISNINSYKGTSLDNSGDNNLFTNTSNLVQYHPHQTQTIHFNHLIMVQMSIGVNWI